MIYAAVVQEHKDVIKVVSADTPESMQAFAQGIEFGADEDVDVMCSAEAAIHGDN